MNTFNMSRARARRHAFLALGVASLAGSALAQVHPAAARAWSTANPVAGLLSTAAGAPIDQTVSIEPTGERWGAIARVDGLRPVPATLLASEDASAARFVDVDWGLLERVDLGVSIPRGERIRVGFPLPEGGQLELVLQSLEWRAPRRFTWIGQIAGVAASDVILVRHDGALRMSVRNSNPGGRLLELRALASGHVVLDVDPIPRICEGCLEGTPADDGGGPPTPEGASASDPTNRVDVLVLATDDSRSAYGSSGAFAADAFAMVADMNFRLSASNAPWSVRMCAAPWNLIEGVTWSGDMHVDLPALSENQAVQDNRSLFRPDLVTMITEYGTGLGTTPGNLDSLHVGNGYSLVKRSLAIGNGTFAHELGHNAGGCHNANASAPNCAQGINGTDRGIERFCDVPDDFCLNCEDREFRTTMAYPVNSPSIRVPRYSVEGQTWTFNGTFGDCSVNLWASNAKTRDTFEVSRQYLSGYNVASSQIWTFFPHIGPESGTWQHPMRTIYAASQIVEGSPTEALIRARVGTYNETNLLGGPVVISEPCTIIPEGGVVVIQ